MRCKCCDVILPKLARDTELCYKCLSVVHDTLYNSDHTVYDVRCYTEAEIRELEYEFTNR